PTTELVSKGKTNKKGSIIRFKPDANIFSTTDFKLDTLSDRLREAAFLFNELKITLIDERVDFKEVYEYENGLKSFIEYLNEGKDGLHDIITFIGEQQGIELDFAFQFSDRYVENMALFGNHVRNKDGGREEVGDRTAVARRFNEYARRNEVLIEKAGNFDGNDIREGLTASAS